MFTWQPGVPRAQLYGLDLTAVYVDAGESAKTLDRPELQRALCALAAGEADAIVVVKLDRLTRSVSDLGALVERSVRRSSFRNGEVVEEEILFRELDERIRDVRVGPDGLLYLLTDSPEARIVQVIPTSGQ